MARATQRITKRVVDAAAAGDREFTIWDSDLRGFGLRVRPSGKKTYIVVYRAGVGRGAPQRRLTIGEPDDSLTAFQARERAADILADVRLGGDPAGTRSKKRKEPTISDLCDRYLREHVAVHNRPSTAARLRPQVENKIKPQLGKIRISDLTRARIKQWHHGLAHRGKPGAKRETTYYEANRCLAVLSKIMSLASTDWELRDDNPCRGLKRFPEKKRDRFYSESELGAIAEALDSAARESAEFPGAIAAIRLLALTGCRLSEILQLRWEHVDIESSAIFLVDAKTGARLVTIGAPAIALLASLPRESDYVVCGLETAKPLTVSAMERVWSRIRAAAGIPDGRMHDFRHTVGTYAGRKVGLNAFAVRDLLGHRTLAMSGRYVERDADPAKAAADAVTGKISAAMAGESAEVLPVNKASEKTG